MNEAKSKLEELRTREIQDLDIEQMTEPQLAALAHMKYDRIAWQ